ncbi:MAG TPA: YdcF family protein [Rhodoferax sp.]
MALTLLLLLGWEPLPDAALRQLEAQYPATSADQDWSAYAGVIVLGGALEPAYVWTVPGQSALNDAAERMTEVVPLLRRQPQLKVLFTGGEGELFANGLSEAERARLFFRGQGLSPDKLLLESASRTTYDNAVMSKLIQGVDATKPWLLLTSAFHMPRAMAAFQKAGWAVTAYPVDFRTGLKTPWTQYSMDQGVKKWRLALHEMLGLLAYRLAGRA